MRVIKRDKSIEEFQWHKVQHAIEEAFKSCDYSIVPDDILN